MMIAVRRARAVTKPGLLWLQPKSPIKNSIRGLLATVRHEGKKDKVISDSSVMIQSGTSIHEMPFIVQVVNGEFRVDYGEKRKNGEGMGIETKYVSSYAFKQLSTKEESEMLTGFLKCNTLKELFQLLDVCPRQEVTPVIAVAVLDKLFQLENSIQIRDQDDFDSLQTFTRNALIKQLVETVCAGKEPQHLIDSLKVLSNDASDDKNIYLEQLARETVIRVSEGKFNVRQVCEIVRAFYNLKKWGEIYIDKVWVGINDKQSEIELEEHNQIIGILPMLKSSRLYLFNLVERKFPLVWHKLEPEDAIRSFQVLSEINIRSEFFLSMLTRWTVLNIHRLSEGNLRWITFCLTKLNYSDSNIKQALDKYMRIKKTNINDPSLVASIMNYCRKMRIRTSSILETGANFYAQKRDKLGLSHIASIINYFGFINYTPKDAFKFFEHLENDLFKNFEDFCP